MARTSNDTFKHGTSIGSNGEILYDCPIEIKNKADLDNYGITWDDCRTLNFHGSEHITVYFYKTESRSFAEYQWSYLNTQHSYGYASTRRIVPNKQNAFIKCLDTNSYAYGKKLKDKETPVISWDRLVESGYDPGTCNFIEEQIHTKMEYAAISALMDKEDRRIRAAFEMKEYGYRVAEIAAKLKVSEPRVCQLIARAKAIGKQYRRDNA
jgi:hypothetical protein